MPRSWSHVADIWFLIRHHGKFRSLFKSTTTGCHCWHRYDDQHSFLSLETSWNHRWCLCGKLCQSILYGWRAFGDSQFAKSLRTAISSGWTTQQSLQSKAQRKLQMVIGSICQPTRPANCRFQLWWPALLWSSVVISCHSKLSTLMTTCISAPQPFSCGGFPPVRATEQLLSIRPQLAAQHAYHTPASKSKVWNGALGNISYLHMQVFISIRCLSSFGIKDVNLRLGTPSLVFLKSLACNIYLEIPTCICRCVYVFLCMSCVYINIHVHMQIHIHIHLHICMYILTFDMKMKSSVI